jgi:hypothetical protein
VGRLAELAACLGIGGCRDHDPEIELSVVSVELDAAVTGEDAGLTPGGYWTRILVELDNHTDEQVPLGFVWFRLVADTGVSHLASPITELEEDGCAAETFVVGGASASCRLVFALDDDELPNSLTYHDEDGRVKAEAGVRICAGARPYLCGRECVDLTSDPDHCGDCGHAVAGECVAGRIDCPAGMTGCDDDCVDLDSDDENCGACGSTVPPGRTCIDGAARCEAPMVECSGQCVELGTDPENCGACGQHVLPDITHCVGGEVRCLDPAQSICDGACVDLAADPENCGACGHPIVPAITECVGGEVTCLDPAESICGDTCFDLDDDVENCGGCGQRCPAAGFGSGPHCEGPRQVCSTTFANPGGSCDDHCESEGWSCDYEAGFCTCAGNYAPGECDCQCDAPVIPG